MTSSSLKEMLERIKQKRAEGVAKTTEPKTPTADQKEFIEKIKKLIEQKKAQENKNTEEN